MRNLGRVLLALVCALALAAGMYFIVPKHGNEPQPVRKTPSYVSFSPGTTETLFALGVGDKVTGVDSWSMNLPEVATAEKAGNLITVGTYTQPNLEAAVRLNPSLIVSEDTAAVGTMQQLHDGKRTVIDIRMKTLTELLDAYRLMGRLVEKEKEGEKLATDILAALEPPVSEPVPAVLLVTPFAGSPEGQSGVGPASYQSEVLAKLGGRNALATNDNAARSFIMIKLEDVLAIQPDIIIYLSQLTPGESEAQMIARAKGTNAYTAGNVFALTYNEVNLKGPRSVLRFAQELRRVLEKWHRAK
jgi:iron complex transport system substrate-binding protein